MGWPIALAQNHIGRYLFEEGSALKIKFDQLHLHNCQLHLLTKDSDGMEGGESKRWTGH